MRRIALLLIGCVIALSLYGCAGSASHDGELQPPLDSEDVSGKNYVDLATQFESAGFSDVKVEGNGELVIGFLHHEGDVQSVSISGKTEFSSRDWVGKDSPVIIRFYSYDKVAGTLTEVKEAEEKAAEEAAKQAAEEEERKAQEKAAEEEKRKVEEKAAAEQAKKEEEQRAKEEEEKRKAEEAKKAEEERLNAFVGQGLREPYKALLGEGKSVKLIHENTGQDMTSVIKDAVENEVTQEDTDFINEWVIRDTHLNEDGSIDLTVNSLTMMAEADQKASMRQALESKLDAGNAWTAAAAYGEQQYPEGFKLHWIMGKLAEEPRDENTWFLKAYCDVTVAGTKATDLNCEALVTGTNDNPQVVSFNVY